ncbi:hypothetical protein DSM106972_044780 [Dulcicalothrix desertica PCC 7102]|uniref:Uncharacterized protein n=1 Tax=Dulcicalothrix desertica PCC 7102 TaxID=232991 RepID=A0A433VDQ3_9CYAN|nr:hypothetical protein [Dulcicalothrix desertica]RUT04250.1 hypothetical protein DSM106972_044780 [Dulcicalothrix desertica PCC 7102]TWH51446.1 hypothetical protein CAL7102_05864 [Dulcicalothrix desertica PCC 7102]
MTTNQPEPTNDRLTRIENRLTNTEAAVVTQSNTIDVLVANIIQLTENVNNMSIKLDNLAEQTNRNINTLAEQAAQDRQQAAIDRQEFRSGIQGILDYLRDRNGGSSPPN